jgi:acyl-CoA thioesterase I
MLRLASRLLACAILALPAPSWAASDTGDACGAPEEFTTTGAPLGQLATAIAAGGPVAVLAIGSATTVGSVSSATGLPTSATPGATFPWHMTRALEAALPGVKFALTVRGGRGMTAEEMLPLLDAALKEQHYPLVLWQTGTVEAARGLRPDGMLDVLHTGAERVRDAGGDLVLIDPQFSRFLRANTDLDPYEGVLQQVATMPGVVMFHRFDLMRAWANDGRIDLEHTQKADRDKALDDLNECLGKALARFVLSGADVQKK